MQKIASNAVVPTPDLQKIAAFGFATLMGSPATGLTPAQVHAVTSRYSANIKAACARHEKLVGLIRSQLPALMRPRVA